MNPELQSLLILCIGLFFGIFITVIAYRISIGNFKKISLQIVQKAETDAENIKTAANVLIKQKEFEAQKEIEKNDYPIQPVSSQNVELTDNFWSKRIATNRDVTIPYCFEKCEETHRIANFEVAGGTWKELAKDLDPSLPENVKSSALLLLRDIFCASGNSEKVKVKCENFQDISSSSSLADIKKTLTASGEIWKKIVAGVDKKIDSKYQKQLYLSLTKILCHD